MKKVVLIVDDSKLARMMLRAIVSDNFPGWYVSEASTGTEALAILKEVRTDFVLLDYNMPGLNGLEVAALMKEGCPGPSIALVTANIQDAIAERARALGIAFFTKPIDSKVLVNFLSAG